MSSTTIAGSLIRSSAMLRALMLNTTQPTTKVAMHANAVSENEAKLGQVRL